MEGLLPEIKRHFAGVRGRLECFCRQQVQVEGWLKGEILFVLDRLKQARQIVGFDREVNSSLGRRKIDIAIDLDNGTHWVELKHWFIGRQRGVWWRVPDYMTALEEEFRKYEAIDAKDRGWILVLCTSNPGSHSWKDSIRQFNKDYRPWQLLPKTSTNDYPESYFLGLLRCDGLET